MQITDRTNQNLTCTEVRMEIFYILRKRYLGQDNYEFHGI